MNEQTLATINDRIQNDKCIICGKQLPENLKEPEFEIVQYNGQPVIVCRGHNKVKEVSNG